VLKLNTAHTTRHNLTLTGTVWRWATLTVDVPTATVSSAKYARRANCSRSLPAQSLHHRFKTYWTSATAVVPVVAVVRAAETVIVTVVVAVATVAAEATLVATARVAGQTSPVATRARSVASTNR
jgi:hypothetical protein